MTAGSVRPVVSVNFLIQKYTHFLLFRLHPRSHALQFASLRGSHAFHTSFLPSIPRALCYDVQRWYLPRPRHRVESHVLWLADRGRLTDATRRDTLVDHQASE